MKEIEVFVKPNNHNNDDEIYSLCDSMLKELDDLDATITKKVVIPSIKSPKKGNLSPNKERLNGGNLDFERKRIE